MSSKKPKRKVGRPKVEIDWEEFDKLCEIQCTQEEIAFWFRCSVDTIDRAVKREKKVNFAEYFNQKRGSGKVALRRAQFQTALSGNPTMLIWLGKNILKQEDKAKFEHTGEGGKPIEVEADNEQLAETIVRRIVEEAGRQSAQDADSDGFERQTIHPTQSDVQAN
jgi:hypothetical protein